MVGSLSKVTRFVITQSQLLECVVKVKDYKNKMDADICHFEDLRVVDFAMTIDFIIILCILSYGLE